MEFTSPTSTVVGSTVSVANTACWAIGGEVDPPERAGAPAVTVPLAATSAATEGCSVKVPEVSLKTNVDTIACVAWDG